MKIRRHQTCFLVKYFEISQTPTRVFGSVKSESYKIIVTHALCCLPLTVACTLAGIHQVCLQSLQRRKKLHASRHCLQVFLFGATFGNLKHRLLDSPETKRQSEVQTKTQLFAGDCRENFNFLSSIRLVRTHTEALL